MRSFATCVVAVVTSVAAAFALSLVPSLEVMTLGARAALATMAREDQAPKVDERIVLVDVASPADPERLADVVELALANGARAVALLAVPAGVNERLRHAIEDCACVVVPEGHPLAPSSALRGHVTVHDDHEEPVPRIILTGKDAGASGAALALALSRLAGTPATLEGRADAYVRPRAARSYSVDDVVTPRIALPAVFRPSKGASLVLIGDRERDDLAMHASLVHELMHGSLLEPPPLVFTLVFSGLVAVAVCALALLAWRRGRAVVAVLVATLFEIALWVNATAALALEDIWLPIAAPTAALTTAWIIAVVRARPPSESDDQR